MALRPMAILGCYTHYKSAAPPDHLKIWEGWTRFTAKVEADEVKD